MDFSTGWQKSCARPVESVEFPLVEERPSGEDGYAPTYARRDGQFGRIVVRSVVAGRDHTAQRAPERGVVLFDPLDPVDSDLFSDPPFGYVQLEPEGHGTPDELASRLHAVEESVETTRYIHELQQVTASRPAFVSHVRTEHIAVEYGDSAPSEAVAGVLTASIEGTSGPATYREEAPPSDGFERVIEDLDLAEITLPEGREVASWLRHYEYRGEYYEARFRISDI